MKTLRTIAWALALTLLLAQAGAAQDKSGDGVVGYEVFSTSTPGGGGTLESQGLTGERTEWTITQMAPAGPGVVNVVVTYYDSKESRDKAKEKEKEKEKKKKDRKKTSGKDTDGPSIPTYDPRFYEYKDGKLVPKDQRSSGARGAMDGNRQMASIEGMVVPDKIVARQPFSFAVPQIPAEAVKIQTVDGVTVRTTTTDDHGRVFVPEGLPMGTYQILTAGQVLGRIEIKQRALDTLGHAPQSLQLQNPPEALKVADRFTLNGHGFSPNAADMRVTLTGSGKTEAPIVLTATEDQLKLAPVQQSQPGPAQLRVTNQATGQSTGAYDVLVYDIQGTMIRRTLKSHKDRTDLVITTRPENLKVQAKVISGPVDFGGGRKEAVGITGNGPLTFPVYSEDSSGRFEIGWSIALSSPCPDGFSPISQDEKTRHENNAKAEDAKGDAEAAKAKTVEDFNNAADHHKKAAAEYRKAGEPGKAADEEKKAANDYRNAADKAKPGSEQKNEQTATAAAEERAGDDHVKEAQNDEKCKDYQSAASEYEKAAGDYTDAAKDYRATNTGHDTPDSKRADEKMKAANNSADADKKK